MRESEREEIVRRFLNQTNKKILKRNLTAYEIEGDTVTLDTIVSLFCHQHKHGHRFKATAKILIGNNSMLGCPKCEQKRNFG